MQPEHRDDEGEFDDRRNDRHHGEARQFLDAVSPSFEHAREASGLALEVKAQRQAVHMLEGPPGEAAHGMQGDAREEPFAHLRQHHHENAHEPVEKGERERPSERDAEDDVGHARAFRGARERIGRPFEGERHRDGDELGDDRQAERSDDTQLEVEPVRWPEIRPQPHHGDEQARLALALAGVFRRLCRRAGPLSVLLQCEARYG